MIELSVIICTHNPRMDYIERTLDALKEQTLDKAQWELIIIDNNSNKLLSKFLDISWHSNGRCIVEEKLGLTPARIRAVKESKSDLLLFVDDDNCLCTSYLEAALTLMCQNQLLGAVGAGHIYPEFEVEPSKEVLPYVGWLALRNETRAHFSNEIRFTIAIPLGAGMCIRKKYAQDYVQSCEERPISSLLDRTGKELLSGGDVDMALHVCKAGKLTGVIPELSILHLIPSSRLKKEYILKLMEGHAFSLYVLSKIWNYSKQDNENRFLKKLRYWKKVSNAKGLTKSVIVAQSGAIKRAQEIWERLDNV